MALSPRIAKKMPVHNKRPRPGMSDAHLRLVRKLPCVVTGIPGAHVDPHHLLRTGEHGMGRRSSDRWAVPLSRALHDDLHHKKGNEDAWFAARGIDARALAKALWAATGDLEAMQRVVFRARQDAALKLRQVETV